MTWDDLQEMIVEKVRDQVRTGCLSGVRVKREILEELLALAALDSALFGAHWIDIAEELHDFCQREGLHPMSVDPREPTICRFVPASDFAYVQQSKPPPACLWR